MNQHNKEHIIHVREKWIARRKHIWKVDWNEKDERNKPDGYYSKNKPNCSCWMCSGCKKSSFAGFKISEKRKIAKLEYIE